MNVPKEVFYCIPRFLLSLPLYPSWVVEVPPGGEWYRHSGFPCFLLIQASLHIGLLELEPPYLTIYVVSPFNYKPIPPSESSRTPAALPSTTSAA